MTLTRIVNGQPVTLSAAEEAAQQAEWDANPPLTAAQVLQRLRDRAKELFDDQDSEGKLWRAVASVLLDELNVLRKWTRDFKIEVAAANSLADLKSRVANNLPTLSDRDRTQARTAVRARLDDASVDSPAS
ncbi:MAG TPA: hypothetical protein VEI97_09120 [bacterium]|nr:hypothetical protein [bacterium]